MNRSTILLESLHVCAWRTVSLSAADVARVDEMARQTHPDASIVASCQRSEAFALRPCRCGAEVSLAGRSALAHLAQVAAGLESVVLGESQILGQVRAAFSEAEQPMRALSDVAIAAAREFRQRTRFNSHAGHLLDRSLTLSGIAARGRLLVLGAGAMGRLVADRGIQLGFDEVVVASRTTPAAGNGDGWRFASLDDLHSVGSVDVVAACLGSGAGEIDFARLPEVRGLAVDLGTPRNFGPGAPCHVLTMADLLADEQSHPHRQRRRAELAAKLDAILDARLAGVAQDSASPVGALRSAVEGVRQRELVRARKLHPEVAPETLDALTRSLVNQIFHEPSRRLKELGDQRLGAELAALFG